MQAVSPAVSVRVLTKLFYTLIVQNKTFYSQEIAAEIQMVVNQLHSLLHVPKQQVIGTKDDNNNTD